MRLSATDPPRWRLDAGRRHHIGSTPRKGNLRTLRTAEPGSGRPERAEAAFGHSLIGVPEVVAR
jgi:hypothetical protein